MAYPQSLSFPPELCVLAADGSYLRYLVDAHLFICASFLVDLLRISLRARVVPYFCADGGWQEVGISVEYGPCFPPKELLSRVHSLTLHVPHKVLAYSSIFSIRAFYTTELDMSCFICSLPQIDCNPLGGLCP